MTIKEEETGKKKIRMTVGRNPLKIVIVIQGNYSNSPINMTLLWPNYFYTNVCKCFFKKKKDVLFLFKLF